MYNACAQGADVIVHWFSQHFKHEEFDIGKAILVACSKGRIDRIARKSCRSCKFSQLRDTRNVVIFLLKNFRNKINNLDTAMKKSLFQSNFNMCKTLIENTSNYFDAEAILEEIAGKGIYNDRECFTFVKYLVSMYSCLNVDILLKIAKKERMDFKFVKWIMSITDNVIFYTACKNHKWIHTEICALKLIYDTKFYDTLDVTTVIEEELRYGNNDCIRFLIEKMDIKRAEQLIVKRVCASGDDNLMQMIFDSFRNLNLEHMMTIAIKYCNLKAVKWLCTNINNEQLNFESIMKEVIKCGNTSIIRYVTEVIDPKYCNSWDIIVAINSSVSFREEDDRLAVIRWYIQDPINRYRINDMMKLSCMKKKKYTQLLIENCNSEFLHLNLTLKAVLESEDFDSLEILLCNFDTTVFDMNSLMKNCIWAKLNVPTGAENITKWLLEKFDPILFDITRIVELACYDDNLLIVQLMYRSYGLSNSSLESLFIHACEVLFQYFTGSWGQ